MKRTINPFTKNLDGFIDNTYQNIHVRSNGYIVSEDRHSHGYNMVKFSSSAYIVQENKTIDGGIIVSGE